MKIFVAGGNGMVGSSLVNELRKYSSFHVDAPNSNQLDLTSQKKVLEYFSKNHYDWVILAAAKVGGVLANKTDKTNFLSENIFIGFNVVRACHKTGIKNLINLGSSCIYPKDCRRPIKEEYLLNGKLEETNDAYALAKITTLKYCEFLFLEHDLNYFSLMPCNLYGPRDNFSMTSSHVIPAMIRKFDDAIINKQDEIELWGTGKPLREFLYVKDLTNAILWFVKKNIKPKFTTYNIGSSSEISIKDLSDRIGSLFGFKGAIKFNDKYPDGVFSKKMDNTRIEEMGWNAKFTLDSGLKETIEWYRNNKDKLRK